MSTIEEKIAQMYDSQLKFQKEQLDTDYMQAVLDLDAQQRKNQQATDANLNRTAVEAQKAAVNNAELQNAYGLSSGTRAQARLAQENQLQADMTALRAAQQNADADVERQRSLLAQEYASAIRKAQAENDLAKAQALYAAAQEEEEKLLAKQEAAGKLMAEVAGDYSLLGKLYGLSEKEVAALAGATTKREPEAPTSATPPVNGGDLISEQTGIPAIPPQFTTLMGSATGTSTPTTPTVPTEPAMPVDVYKDIVSEVTGNKPAVPDSEQPEQNSDLPVDQDSIDALGFGLISEEYLNELVEAGIVEEYVEDGKIKFRKKKVSSAGSALNPWWKRGI